MRNASIIPAATFILAVSCHPLAFLGQIPNSPPGQPTEVKAADLCSLEGTVTSAKTGEPVKKALVEIYPTDKGQSYFSVTTDASGHFVFKNLAAGRYQLGASANGYVPQRYGARSFGHRGASLTLSSGQHKDGIDFRLTPWGVISGAVCDQDGDPVVGGMVRAMRSVYADNGRRQWSYFGMARTDDRGEYRLYGIPPGRYLVVASYQGGRAPAAVEEAYVPAYYPSGTDPGQASPVRVGPGEEIGEINLYFIHARGVCVRGRVTNFIPGQSLFINLIPHRDGGAEPDSHYSSAANDQGEFEIRHVPPGEYVAYAIFGADAGPQYVGRSEVSVGNVDVNGVNISPSPGIDIRGRVRIETPPQFDFTHLSVGLRGVDDTQGQAVAETKADGTFVVPAVFDGIYRLVVRGFPEELYLKSARLGDTDVLGKILEVSHTQPPGTFDLMFSPNGGRIDGTVLDEQNPVQGAVVVFVPDAAHREHDELYSVTTTDSQGRFSLLGLPPGDFTLYAFDELEDYAAKDPEFLRPYADRGTAVHIVEKQRLTVRLKLIAVGE